MGRDLSRTLHALTARLDRAADRILQANQGTSYRRFLALYMVREKGGTTQRELAKWLGLTEPSVSRMVRVLDDAGLLRATPDDGGGNRRRVELTADGEKVVTRCGALLEDRFAALVEAADVSYDDYGSATRRLLRTLTEAEEESGGAASGQHASPPRSSGRPASRRTS